MDISATITTSNDKQKTIQLLVDGETHSIGSKNACFNELLEALVAQDQDKICDIVSPLIRVSQFTEEYGLIKVSKGQVFYDGEILNNNLTERICDFIQRGITDISPLLKFLEKTLENPSLPCREHAFSFISKHDLPVLPNGNFVGYKRVDADYFSYGSGPEEIIITSTTDPEKSISLSGHVPYYPGTIVSMDRSVVVTDRNSSCNVGLHVASHDYVKGFHPDRGRIVLVSVNPKDIVSVPRLYTEGKCRACRVEVLGEVKKSVVSENNMLSVGFMDSVIDEGATLFYRDWETKRMVAEKEREGKENTPVRRDPENGRFLQDFWKHLKNRLKGG